jgi:plasmid stabilization system protein ParE
MKFELRISGQVRSELLAIAQWYLDTSQSLKVADDWHSGAMAAIHNLAKTPLAGKLAAESYLFEFELRELHYGSGRRPTHRVLYRVIGDLVEVLTIRHHAQQPLKRGDLSP